MLFEKLEEIMPEINKMIYEVLGQNLKPHRACDKPWPSPSHQLVVSLVTFVI